MSEDNNPTVDLDPLEAARLAMEEAAAIAAEAAEKAREAEEAYNAIVSERAPQAPLHAAVSDYFATQDKLAAERAEAFVAMSNPLSGDYAAPSVLDAGRALAAKTKKRTPQKPKD